jgi:hypothetical protein
MMQGVREEDPLHIPEAPSREASPRLGRTLPVTPMAYEVFLKPANIELMVAMDERLVVVVLVLAVEEAAPERAASL